MNNVAQSVLMEGNFSKLQFRDGILKHMCFELVLFGVSLLIKVKKTLYFGIFVLFLLVLGCSGVETGHQRIRRDAGSILMMQSPTTSSTYLYLPKIRGIRAIS